MAAGAEPRIFWTGSDVVRHQLPDIPFLIHPFLPQTGIVLLHGKYGSYKTPLTIHIAHSVATGTPCFEFPTTQTKVLYIEGDTPQTGLWSRLQVMNPDTDNLHFAFLYPGFNSVHPRSGERNAKICEALAKQHSEHKYGLVVIDSLRTSHLLPDKDSEVPSQVYGSLANLFPGACLFLVHHDRKTRIPDKFGKRFNNEPNEEVDNESFSGSQAWIDRATTSLKIHKGYSKDKKWITLVQSKSQVGPIMDPLPLHVEDGCRFSLTPPLTDQEIIDGCLLVGKVKNKFDLDEKLSTHFQIPLKIFIKRRAELEANIGASLFQTAAITK